MAICTLAQHPTAGLDTASYVARVAPKSIYTYLTGIRGWNHSIGIDAKAQNGPTTEVGADDAIAALNLLLTASPVFIALFANSPFESGKATGLMETRMTLWPRMVANSRAPADRERCGLPPRLFDSFADYWSWTFAPNTEMHAVPQVAGSYKGDGALCIAGDAKGGAADFFRSSDVTGRDLTGSAVRLQPSAQHFEYLQWSNFLDFRLRFAFGNPLPEREEIAAAFAQPALFDRLFHDRIANLYIENRCAGASFPDADLKAHAGDVVASGAMIGPSALQAGLVMAACRGAGTDLVQRWPLDKVRALREHAIKQALGASDQRETSAALRALCADVFEMAASHLPPNERKGLRYPMFVLETGLTGAARALLARPRFTTLDALALSRQFEG